MKIQTLKVLSLLLLLLIVSGCGYHNPNMLPADQQGRVLKLYVPIWPNPTNEIKLASDIHNALQDWLGQSKQFALVNSAKQADYILNGRIVSVSYSGQSYTVTNQAVALNALLSVNYSVTDTSTGKTAWQANGFTLTETYSLQTDANKKQALDTLVDNLAEQIYIRLYSAISRNERNKAQKH